MTDEELLRLCAVLPPHPWEHELYSLDAGGIPVKTCGHAGDACVQAEAGYQERCSDLARFLAAARAAVPRLLAEKAALLAEVERLRAERELRPGGTIQVQT